MYCPSPTAYLLYKVSHPLKLKVLKNRRPRKLLGNMDPKLKNAFLRSQGVDLNQEAGHDVGLKFGKD